MMCPAGHVDVDEEGQPEREGLRSRRSGTLVQSTGGVIPSVPGPPNRERRRGRALAKSIRWALAVSKGKNGLGGSSRRRRDSPSKVEPAHETLTVGVGHGSH